MGLGLQSSMGALGPSPSSSQTAGCCLQPDTNCQSRNQRAELIYSNVVSKTKKVVVNENAAALGLLEHDLALWDILRGYRHNGFETVSLSGQMVWKMLGVGKSQQIDINVNKLRSGHLYKCMMQNIDQSSYLRRMITG